MSISGQHMRILVRLPGRLYLGTGDNPVAEPDAREFNTIPEAGHAAIRLPHAAVVLSYQNPRCELQLDPVYCVSAPLPARLPPEGPTSPPQHSTP